LGLTTNTGHDRDEGEGNMEACARRGPSEPYANAMASTYYRMERIHALRRRNHGERGKDLMNTSGREHRTTRHPLDYIDSSWREDQKLKVSKGDAGGGEKGRYYQEHPVPH